MTKASRRGESGFVTTGPDGLTSFASLDGKTTIRETRQGDAKFSIVTRVEEGRTTVTTYDAKNAKVSALVIEPAGKDGLVRLYGEDKPWPKSEGRYVDGKFVASRVLKRGRLEQGERRRGRPRRLDAQGQGRRRERLAAWIQRSFRAMGPRAPPSSRRPRIGPSLRGSAGSRGNKAQDKYQADSIAAFLGDALHSRPGNTQTQIFFDSGRKQGDGQRQFEGGRVLPARRQVRGHVPPGGASGKGSSLRGSRSTRAAQLLDGPDPQAKFSRVEQYLGTWGREMMSSKVTDNLDSVWSYISGPKVEETPGRAPRLPGDRPKRRHSLERGPGGSSART